jgi:hypothetical protein
MGNWIKTSVKIRDSYFSVEPDENEGIMEFFVEKRLSDNEEDISSAYALLTPDELEYLAKRILDAVDYYRKHNSED